MGYAKDVLELVGKTPLVRINRLNKNPNVEILAKLEYFNPGGSVKDRAAYYMIKDAEEKGILHKKKTILEATSGNTGIGLALVAAVKGYRVLLVMSESVSEERVKILKALGAEIKFTPAHMGTDGAIEYAYSLARAEPENYWLADQFNNESNWKAHYYGTAMEIWEDTGGEVDYIVATMGTTGTLMGISRRMAELAPHIKVIGVEPYLGHKIQGLKNMKESYVPGIYERYRLHKVIHIDDELAYETARRLAKEEGIFVGMSSGAAMAGALKIAQGLERGRVVVILPDTGERYLSTPLFVVKKTTGVRLFNTLSRKLEEVVPIKEPGIKIYCCGPILNDYLNLGIARRLIVADVLRRYLEQKGLEVDLSINLTDLDDRTIEAAEQGGKSLKEFSDFYFQALCEDLKRLSIKEPLKMLRASEHLNDMAALVERLIQKGFAYEKFRSVYFDISRLRQYGSLSKIDLSKIKVGKTVDLNQYEKDNPRDFTLFKRCTLNDLKRGIFYETRWGKVRPSWHLECAALSHISPGLPYDVHISGTELLFPHNENTFAIGFALVDKSPANIWVHVDQVEWEEQGVRNGIITIREILERGFSARLLRYALLLKNYKRRMRLTINELEVAKGSLERLDRFVRLIQSAPESDNGPDLEQHIYDLKQGFHSAMDDDMNISKALSSLFGFESSILKTMVTHGLATGAKEGILEALRHIDSVFMILDFQKHPEEGIIHQLVQERERVRKARDWQRADEIRAKLKGMGVVVMDTPKGPVWSWTTN